jgi:hypothetical protein
MLANGGLGTKMVQHVSKTGESKLDKSQLAERDVRLLLIVCAEIVNFCARVTGKIDPTASAMLAYVRDDILSESKIELPYS